MMETRLAARPGGILAQLLGHVLTTPFRDARHVYRPNSPLCQLRPSDDSSLHVQQRRRMAAGLQNHPGALSATSTSVVDDNVRRRA